MKISPFIKIPALAAVSVTLLAGVSPGSAQNARSGAAAADRSEPSATVSRATADLKSSGVSPEVNGQVDFGLAGDLLNVTGRIEGLTPLRKYRLTVMAAQEPKKTSEKEAAEPAEDPAGTFNQPGRIGVPIKPLTSSPDSGSPQAPKPNAGMPNAGQPQAPQPNAGMPNAGQPQAPQPNAGMPDGEDAQIALLAGGAGMKDVTIVTADPNGSANLNASLRDMPLSKGPDGLIGKMLVVELMPEEAATEVPRRVAQGTVQAGSAKP